MMKHSKIVSMLFAAALVFVQLTATVLPAQAQEGGTDPVTPWDYVFDTDGNLLPGATDMGEVEIDPPPAWWPYGWLPLLGDFHPTYHQYVSANGDIVLAPSASTLLIMAFNPEESGILNSYSYVANGGGSLVMNILLATESGQSIIDRIKDMGYADPEEFFDQVTAGEGSIWSFGFNGDLLNLMRELHRISRDDDMIATTLLLYVQGTCAGAPTGCPENLCQIAPAACEDDDGDGQIDLPPSCPLATITPGTVYYEAVKLEPNNPIPVGQDPDRRGVDVNFQVTIGPTVYEYFILVPVIEDVDECYVPDGGYGGTLNCKTDDALPANNGYWRTTQEIVDFECEQYIQTYPEPITQASVTAFLSDGSEDWITGGLASYYYEADVYQNAYLLFPTYGVVQAGCGADNVCTATGTALRVPFRDPGLYRMTVTVQTAGTPVTTGRTVGGPSQEFQVYLISAREIMP